MSERILVADDEEVFRKGLCDYLTKAGYEVDGVADGTAAYQSVLAEDYALCLSDIRMPGLDGVALLQRIVAERPETSVLLVTAFASVDTAVEALRLGAFDYLLKPVAPEDVLQKVRNLLAYRSLKGEVARLRREIGWRLGFGGIVGSSPGIRQVFDLVESVAPTGSTVLLTGESGTGKELVARVIHDRSKVADREFVAVNVAAIPGEVIESQLFGHQKGAFTGADRRREGLLRSVHGGSVFLDEIGELTPSVQVKLLRAIEMKEILPVGSERPLRADFRLVTATNRKLEDAVESGQFRQDLFFRLNGFRIDLPPLRDRREDIPALVQHFLHLHSRGLGRRNAGVTNETMRVLCAYAWPGNVRELGNAIERAVLLAAGAPIGIEHLPAELRSGPTLPLALREAVECAERQHIAWVLRMTGGNREEAARRLEVDRATLYRRLEKYKLG